jgi:hypothetical protein
MISNEPINGAGEIEPSPTGRLWVLNIFLCVWNAQELVLGVLTPLRLRVLAAIRSGQEIGKSIFIEE